MTIKNWLGLVFVIVLISIGLNFWAPSETTLTDSSESELVKVDIAEAYLNIPPPGHSTTAAYLHSANLQQSTLTAVAFESSKATKVELHEHVHADGMMKMRKVDQLVLLGMETKVFQPMGYHLMVFGLTDGIEPGEMVDFTLTLASGERVIFQAQARGLQ